MSGTQTYGPHAPDVSDVRVARVSGVHRWLEHARAFVQFAYPYRGDGLF